MENLCYPESLSLSTFRKRCFKGLLQKTKYLLIIYIMDIRLMLVYLCLFYLVSAKDMKYYSNFKLGPLQVGRESVVKDFVTIENDPVSNLPNEFTICTSLFIDIVKSSQYLFEILKKDGTHWFSIAHATRSATTNDELFFCYQTGKYLFLKYTLKLSSPSPKPSPPRPNPKPKKVINPKSTWDWG